MYDFLCQLQKATSANDKRAVSLMIYYPLNIIVEGHKNRIRSKSALVNRYDEIFTPKVKSAIVNQKPEKLFVNSTGFMIGRGELWFDEINGNFKIVTIEPR